MSTLPVALVSPADETNNQPPPSSSDEPAPASTPRKTDRHELSENDIRAIGVGIAAGKSLSAIGRELGRSHSVIQRAAKRLHMKPSVSATHGHGGSRKRIELPEAEVLRLHRQGLTKSAIAARFSVSLTPITRILERTLASPGAKRPQIGRPVGFRPPAKIDDKRLMAMRKQGASVDQIAREFNVSHSSVSRHITELGIQRGARPARVLSPGGRERIAAAQHARWAAHRAETGKAKVVKSSVKKGAILTSDVEKVRGKYPCPECGESFVALRHLGRHRTTHGITGVSRSATQAKIARAAAQPETRRRSADGLFHCTECGHTAESPNGAAYHLATKHNITDVKFSDRKEDTSYVVPPVTQLVPSHSPAGTIKGWTDESVAGFIFAHVVNVIDNACKGRENSKPYVTQRVSELLHHEILRAT